MNKKQSIYTSIFFTLILQNSFTDTNKFPSLKNTILRRLLKHKTWQLYGPTVKKNIGILPGGIFDSLKIKNIDLSGICIKEEDFNKCTFISVHLEDADLKNARLEDCIFKQVNIRGAKLCDGYEFNDKLSPLELVHEYSQFVDAGEIKKAQALNKVLGPLRLNLKNQNLSGLNLKGINFQNANLEDANLQEVNLTEANLKNTNLNNANLQGVLLSENVKIPPYQHPNELFNKWAHGEPNEKIFYQKLVNAHFNLFRGISNKQLQDKKWNKLDLSNANLSYIQLQNNDLTDTNLKRADLHRSNLQNTILKGANLNHVDLYNSNLQNTNLLDVTLKKTNLREADLHGALLSIDVKIPPYQHPNELFKEWTKSVGEKKALYQKLINAKFNLFDQLSNNDLKSISWQALNLKYAELSFADFQGIDLTQVNLSHANLHNAIFYKATLNNANFKKANLYDTDFEEASLIGANFKKANLESSALCKADLTNTNLSRANLKFADLTSAILIKTKLKNTDFTSAILTETNLENTAFTSANMTDAIL